MNGPPVVGHDQTNIITANIMDKITARSTKSEILAAYVELQHQIEQGATWGQVWLRLRTTWQTASHELPLLVKDCYNAGGLARQWISGIVDELSRPVLR